MSRKVPTKRISRKWLGLAAALAGTCGVFQGSLVHAGALAAPPSASGTAHAAAATASATASQGTSAVWQGGDCPGLPAPVPGLTGVVAGAAGDSHSLALESDGTVWSWDDSPTGQIPAAVPGLRGVTTIAAGAGHSLAIRADRTLWAWGDNNAGDLGNGGYASSATPVQVRGLVGVTAIAGGNSFSLAVGPGGSVWSWGADQRGQLGNGTWSYNPYPTPLQVQGLSGVTAVAAGDEHGLALRSDGTVWAWGLNDSGQLGIGNFNLFSPRPVEVSGLRGVVAIAAGGEQSLALKSDGSVWYWGYQGNDTVGEGYALPQWSGRFAAAIAAGEFDWLALHNGNVFVAQNEGCGLVPPSSSSGYGQLTGVTAIAAGGSRDLVLGGCIAACLGGIDDRASKSALSQGRY